MPEFYRGSNCRYQLRAQPYLDAIAHGVRDSPKARAFLLEGTGYEQIFELAQPVWQEQRARREKRGPKRCPFWSNYFYDPCSSCDCRIDDSVSMEVDAIFFLRNVDGKILAVHIEMKRDWETFEHGQPEAYRPRAACYRDQRRERETLLDHHYFTTVLFCGPGTDLQYAEQYFDKVIPHEKARKVFQDYPSDT